MNRLLSSLIVVTSLAAALAWACGTSPSGADSIQGPALMRLGSSSTFKLMAPGDHGQYGDQTGSATWTVTPAANGRVGRAGSITALAAGPMTVSATLGATTSTISVTVVQADQFQVSGTVRDSSGQPIAGAIVSAHGTAFGFAQQTTDAGGAYALAGVIGSATVTAQFLFGTATKTVSVVADTAGIDFVLAVPAGLVDLSGEWTATFAAPTSCASSPPAIAQSRTYTVTIQAANTFRFYFASPTLVFSPVGFEASFTGSALNLPLPDSTYYGVLTGGLLEKLGPGQWLDVSGAVTASPVTATAIPGIFAGQFDYYEVDPQLTGPLVSSAPKVHCAGSSPATFAKTGATSAGRRRR